LRLPTSLDRDQRTNGSREFAAHHEEAHSQPNPCSRHLADEHRSGYVQSSNATTRCQEQDRERRVARSHPDQAEGRAGDAGAKDHKKTMEPAAVHQRAQQGVEQRWKLRENGERAGLEETEPELVNEQG